MFEILTFINTQLFRIYFNKKYRRILLTGTLGSLLKVNNTTIFKLMSIIY